MNKEVFEGRIGMVCDSLHIICGNCGSLLTIGNQKQRKGKSKS